MEQIKYTNLLSFFFLEINGLYSRFWDNDAYMYPWNWEF